MPLYENVILPSPKMCYPGLRKRTAVIGGPSVPSPFENLVPNLLSHPTHILYPNLFLILLASDPVIHFPLYSLTHAPLKPATSDKYVYFPLKLWPWYPLWLYRLREYWVNAPAGFSLPPGPLRVTVPHPPRLPLSAGAPQVCCSPQARAVWGHESTTSRKK